MTVDIPRVLIADDHHAIRAGVRLALEEGGCQVVAEADSAFSAVELAREHQPEVCLLDITMPGGGLWALRSILEQAPDIRCLMLTVSRDAADVVESLERGAMGYLLKDVRPAELPRAVRAALAGEAVLDGHLTAVALGALRWGLRGDGTVTNADGRQITLTPREWDALDLLLEGFGTQDIARHLGVRPITVRRHISDAMTKLRVSSRVEVVALLRSQRSTPHADDSDRQP